VRPRADEVLANVIDTYDRYVLPDVTDPYAKSMATVISGLLKQVNDRVALEGQALYDDVREARAVLADVREYLGSAPDIDKVLDAEYRGVDEYPSLRSLADESAALTTVLDDCLRALVANKVTGDERYDALRARIRAFAAAQLRRESAWGFATIIDPGL
jgi:hypothetical protein